LLRRLSLRTSAAVQPPLFDQQLRALRRRRMSKESSELFLHVRAFDDAIERAAVAGRGFERALLVGCVDRSWRSRLAELAPAVTEADDIASIEPAAFDLVVAIGEIESAPDPRLHLFALARALRPGGMIAGAIVGGASLPALRSALIEGSRETGRAALRVHPMIDGPALSLLLTSVDLTDAVVEIDRVDVSYRSLDRLAADLRAMGCTSVLAERQPLRRAEWDAARRAFLAGGERRVERFELIHFTAWAR
jgi:SAM-dependent methyltransferase